jgi:hypothetical protein
MELRNVAILGRAMSVWSVYVCDGMYRHYGQYVDRIFGIFVEYIG